jgi:ankyrin repeat protein
MDVFQAIEENDVEHVSQLVAENPSTGAQRNDEGVSARLMAQYYGRSEIANELVGPDSDLDVFEAAAYGRTERVRELLEGDLSLASAWSPDGFQPLGLAVFFGHPATARLLIDRGADVNTVARHAHIKATPIHSAAAASEPAARFELTQLLLEHGADVNVAQEEGGFTPLHAAAQHGDLELVKLLLDRGANTKATLDDGRTPRAVAADEGHEQLGELLA